MSRATFTEAEIQFLSRMRVARLATASADGQPHVIPIVFAIDSRHLYTPLDAKPKQVEPRQLKRVRNIQANSRVAVVVDHYDEDWTQLAWILIQGRAQVVEAGESYDLGVRLVREKYPQYAEVVLERRPFIVVLPEHVANWGKLRL